MTLQMISIVLWTNRQETIISRVASLTKRIISKLLFHDNLVAFLSKQQNHLFCCHIETTTINYDNKFFLWLLLSSEYNCSGWIILILNHHQSRLFWRPFTYFVTFGWFLSKEIVTESPAFSLTWSYSCLCQQLTSSLLSFL